MQTYRISITADTIIEPNLSGENRTFTENAKRLLEKGLAIDVFTSVP